MTTDPGKLPEAAPRPPLTVAYALVGIVVIALVLYAFGLFGGIPDTPRGQLLRAGALALAAGILLATYFGWRSRLPDRLPGIAEDSLSYTIAMLTQRRDILASIWIWLLLPLVPGIALLYAGAANLRGVGVTWALVGLIVSAIILIAIGIMGRLRAAEIDTQIAQLQKQR
ncbi:MAG TPA: hypothetical protein PK286_06775 [Devosia sp.]|nr:hypothetical protein [Devosia sp.]